MKLNFQFYKYVAPTALEAKRRSGFRQKAGI
jgi:hypothetical protein